MTGVDPAEGMLRRGAIASGRRAGLLDQERGPDHATAAALRPHLHDRPRLPGPADATTTPSRSCEPPTTTWPTMACSPSRPAIRRERRGCPGRPTSDGAPPRQTTARSRSSSTRRPSRTPASWTSPHHYRFADTGKTIIGRSRIRFVDLDHLKRLLAAANLAPVDLVRRLGPIAADRNEPRVHRRSSSPHSLMPARTTPWRRASWITQHERPGVPALPE